MLRIKIVLNHLFTFNFKLSILIVIIFDKLKPEITLLEQMSKIRKPYFVF